MFCRLIVGMQINTTEARCWSVRTLDLQSIDFDIPVELGYFDWVLGRTGGNPHEGDDHG
jgi:hypothetical protein